MKMKLESLPYYNALKEIRRTLEHTYSQFPKGACSLASLLVQEKIPSLEAIAGKFQPLNRPHAWNFDPHLDIFIDLTMDQFALAMLRFRGKYLAARVNNRVVALSSSTALLLPKDYATTLIQSRNLDTYEGARHALEYANGKKEIIFGKHITSS